jgi:hypothetical protein
LLARAPGPLSAVRLPLPPPPLFSRSVKLNKKQPLTRQVIGVCSSPGRLPRRPPAPSKCPRGFPGGSSAPLRRPRGFPAFPRRPRGAPEGPPASSRRQSTNQAYWTFGLLVGSWNLVFLAHPQPTNQVGPYGLLVGSTNRPVFGFLSAFFS